MLIKVKIKPGSERFRISIETDESGYYLRIWLKSHPEKGKANKELLKELKKLFGRVELVSGATSREKYINIDDDIDLEEIIKNKRR
ncbi:MAG: YggU family protein [Candidatus Aenigmarchaeota archaeon]|nr:YggU family protein [Candidatus Aenigmarchaeota archaeon]